MNGLEFERRDDDPQARMHRRREACHAFWHECDTVGTKNQGRQDEEVRSHCGDRDIDSAELQNRIALC